MSAPPNFNSMRQSHLPQSTNQSSSGQSVNEKTIQSINEPNIMGQLVSYNNDSPSVITIMSFRFLSAAESSKD